MEATCLQHSNQQHNEDDIAESDGDESDTERYTRRKQGIISDLKDEMDKMEEGRGLVLK